MTGHDVLIVNSRSDESWARWAADVLRDAGRTVGLLQDGLREFLDVGEVIERETRAAGQVVVLLSKSAPVFLADAVSVANRLGRRVLPVHLDDSPALYARPLAHLHALDLTGLALDTAGRKLLSALEDPRAERIRPNHVRRPPPAPAELVGRERELAGLHGVFFGDPAGPGHSAVVVAGERGVGKSALVAQFIRMNRTRWAHVLWSSPTRFAADQLRAITRPRGPALLVIDGAEDYHSIRDPLWPVLLDRDLVNVLVTATSPAWPDPFRVIELGPLEPVAARRLVDLSVPALAAEPGLGSNPGTVAALAGLVTSDLVADLAAGREIARAVRAGERGFYYLDSENPAVVAAFERAFVEVGPDVELLSAGRCPWRRWWRGRRTSGCPASVPAVTRLLAAAEPVPRLVITVDSTVFVKAPFVEAANRIVTRRLSEEELRRFEHSQRLRRDPVPEALGDIELVERAR